jgi:hypothetical protein
MAITKVSTGIKWTTPDMERVLVYHFGMRRNMIVPNVSWGLHLHECDLLIVTDKGWATEVEIKISAADLKKDMKKRHGHRSSKISKFYYAVPHALEALALELCPGHAGILVVKGFGNIPQVRAATPNPDARKLTEAEQIKLGKLAAMRIWSLKRTIANLRVREKLWKLGRKQ